MSWSAWNLDRIVILFVSLAYLLVGIQVTLYHYRQNFHHKIMWLPVVLSPLLFLAMLLLTFNLADGIITLNIWLLWFAVLAGLIGFYRHFKGVGQRVGGYELRNFLIGPPVILPLVFSAVGGLGLIAIYFMI